MADKEAFVYVVDVGSSMANCNTDRAESDLEWSMSYVWDKIATTTQASRKTWCVGVIGFRTDETKNKYQEDDGFDNISVLKELGPIDLPQLKELKNTVKPSNTETGDAVSAIVVAAEMIGEFTKKNKYTRRIYLITDGQGPIDGDDIDEISNRLNDLNIELIVLGVDFDDPDFGFKEEDKPLLKATNEAILKALVGKCNNGDFATMAAAVDELAIPRVKPVKLVKNFDGPLTLGDPVQFPSAISINVERWPVTKVNRPSAATTVVITQTAGATQSTHTIAGDMDEFQYDEQYSSVAQHRTYKVNDPGAPGGKRDVEFENLAKGYSYGSTAVPIAESEWDLTNLGTEKGFSIMGFVHMDKVEPFITLGETCVTVARPWDEGSKLSLSALIHALYESETYAVARLVPRDNKDPVILLLRPSIEPDFECLYDVPLPFAEDVRSYPFPPIDRVITVTGKTLTQNRLLPDVKLNQAMSNYVDAMDLAEFDRDEKGNPQEYAALDDLYSPMIHRVNQLIRARAVDENKGIPDIPSILKKFATPPEKLIGQVKPQIEALIKRAEVKPVPEKAKGKRSRGPTQTPSSGFDVDNLLDKGLARKRNKISKENAIPEFKQTLRQRMHAADKDEEIENAVKEMGQIIRSLIKESMGDKDYARAQENIGVMREQCIEFESPQFYNDFLTDLKKQISSGALGGDRREMWTKYIKWPGKGRLGLITKSQCEGSGVTDDEAQQFW